MGAAHERGEAAVLRNTGMQRPLTEAAEFGASLVRRKLDLDRLAGLDGHREKRARRGIDETKTRAPAFDQGDIDGEVASLLNELLGAVQRIDEEEAVRKRA